MQVGDYAYVHWKHFHPTVKLPVIGRIFQIFPAGVHTAAFYVIDTVYGQRHVRIPEASRLLFSFAGHIEVSRFSDRMIEP